MRYWKVVSLVVIVAIVSGLWFMRPSARFAKYRYKVGAPAMDEGAHMAFLEEKVKKLRDPIYELNELAALYASRAKWTSDETFYDKAEAAAKRSLSMAPKGNHSATLVLAEVAQARHSFKEAMRLGEEVLAEAPTAEGGLILMTTCQLADRSK